MVAINVAPAPKKRGGGKLAAPSRAKIRKNVRRAPAPRSYAAPAGPRSARGIRRTPQKTTMQVSYTPVEERQVVVRAKATPVPVAIPVRDRTEQLAAMRERAKEIDRQVAERRAERAASAAAAASQAAAKASQDAANAAQDAADDDDDAFLNGPHHPVAYILGPILNKLFPPMDLDGNPV